ncbi:receptor-type tyrosine-protein phosphatase epsilon isoform X1 [Magallana gigas]|uniref:receptor-type tyrosine-protein phosphatase epsilon isoform X1 n=1 Tax=Magallana gigas TaxID=29159 RepID=UPI00333EB01A
MWSDLARNLLLLQVLVSRTSCYVNVAHKPLQGSATMNGIPHTPNWSADKVVDGNTNQTAYGGSCAIMDFSKNYRSVWLNVQLQRLFNVAYIEIYFRNENTFNRLAGFSISAFNEETFNPGSPDPHSLVYHHDPMSGCPAPILNITVNRLARQIVFTNQRPQGYQSTCSSNEMYTNVEICEIKVMGCDDNRYSSGCGSLCSTDCKDRHCDAFNGSCIYGCLDSNVNTLDCKECMDGTFVSNRVCHKCPGHCKNDEFCNKTNGKCDNGCKNYWTGYFCHLCSDHYFGLDCGTPCGHCLNNDVCNNKTGICPGGCHNHWTGERCDVCSNNYYGSNCDTPCGQCNNNDVCNNVTGHCPNGCQNHWAGSRCDVCSNNYYGSNCDTPCGQCNNNDVCNNVTGHCPNGCQNHWAGSRCDVCSNNYYGSKCDTPCGQCNNNDVCNNVTGHCPNGCQNHWAGSRCDECSNNFYGADCDNQCGNCMNNSVCHNMTGICSKGCHNNWQGQRCDECRDGFYNVTCNQQCGNCNEGKPCDKINGICLNGCSPQFQPPLCKAKHVYKQDTNSGALAGGIVSLAIVLLAVAIIIFIYRRHRGTKEATTNAKSGQNYADMCNTHEASPGEFVNEAVIGDNGTYCNTTELNIAIRVDDLQCVISEKSIGENKAFLSEYKRLPVGNTEVCKQGRKKENISRNRFKTTFPYDHSRVILKEGWTDADNDYINANFIRDFNGKTVYIAAQGPRTNTLADFWRMIWQENVRCIVMLTNLIENGKNKCTQYWPENDSPFEVGPCKMQLLEETTYAFYTLRKFTVLNTKTSGKRTITQFHYTAWPDHGTPEEIGLVQFHRAVTRKYQQGKLMLVHCSAGVGRTGTFIGLDSLLKQGRETRRINVFEFVKQMREDRMTMVQTPDQYIFLHKALLYVFEYKNTAVLQNDIQTNINALLHDTAPFNQRTLNEEYKFLQTIKPAYDDEDKADGRRVENKKKNVNMDIIPISKYRPYLTSFVNGRNDYINAVCVPSFVDLGALIITQMPLHDTEVDLWRLCVDHDIQAIVILNENNEELHLIPKRGSNRICAPYILTTGNTGSDIIGLSQNTLMIAHNDQKIEVDVLNIPVGNDSSMLKGVELLLEKEKRSNFKSVIISRDGAGPAGIFCVLHNALQQLRTDGEVDILTTVRLVQSRRPEVITKLEEYKKCYELILLFVSEDGIYANM